MPLKVAAPVVSNAAAEFVRQRFPPVQRAVDCVRLVAAVAAGVPPEIFDCHTALSENHSRVS